MPNATIALDKNPEDVWNSGTSLTKITLNKNVEDINGKWFIYASNINEICGPERDDIKFYEGCVYNSDYSKLIYWPCKKTYDENLLPKDDNGNIIVQEFGERSLSQNQSFSTFVIPDSVTILGD